MLHAVLSFASSLVLLLVAGAVQSCADGLWPAGEFGSDRIRVVTRGRGPDIILVPGLFSHRDVWSGVAERLDGRYRLHLVQVNGFAGAAPRANAEGAVAAPVAEALAGYIRNARLDRPTVVGHSMGGSVAMMLAARHPERVGRLLIVDTPPFMGIAFGGDTAQEVQPVADRIRAQILAEPPGLPTGLIGQLASGMTRTDAMQGVLLEYARTSDRRTVANAFHELIVTDLRPELGRITAPMTVLYVVPPHVPVSPEDFAAALRRSFANAPRVRLVRIEDSHHFIQFDQPARLAELAALMRQ